jgi:L-fuconolactonase
MTDEHHDPVPPDRRRDATVLDSHVHFWDTRGNISYPWLKEAPPLERPFTPEDFDAVRPAHSEAIFVEAGRAEEHAAAEIEWVREQARQHPWIVGAVAHVRLEDPETARTAISRYAEDPFVVGVRRNVQDEPPGYLADPGLRAGVRLLGEAGLPFDACVREQQLPELVELAAACPGTTIVLDHLGKPKSAAKRRPWWQVLRQLADRDNVVCKLSGLATEIPVNTPRTPGRVRRRALPVRRRLAGADPGHLLRGLARLRPHGARRTPGGHRRGGAGRQRTAGVRHPHRPVPMKSATLKGATCSA